MLLKDDYAPLCLTHRHFITSHHHKKKNGEYSIMFQERYHIHIPFITVYYYNSPVLITNVLLCLIYKLSFTIGMYECIGKSSMYGVSYYQQLQASTGGLEHIPHG